MHTICVDPRTDLVWQELVNQHRSTVFHSPAWIRVLTETYGWEVHAFVILNNLEEPVAGMPFCRISDILGERIVILPFSDYCDPLVTDNDQWKLLIDTLLVEHCPISMRCLHNSLPLFDQRFTLVKQAKWHGMDLQPDLDTLWRRLHDRASITKAQRNGVRIQIAQEKEELRAFFELHLRTRKYKYHLLAQPYHFFENIWHHFIETQKGALMLAVYQDEIIGGVLFLESKDTLYYKFNASLPAHLAHSPNDLLMWEGIKYAKAKGHAYLDFGLSDWDQEGLVRYKRKFATEEKAISFLRYASDGTPTQQDQQVRRLLTQLTNLFTDESVPESITEKAGEILYRFFG
jgi:lipid II:glycine glycyltransferase (peptidoglycan interpeptide bridge formation enzyme)